MKGPELRKAVRKKYGKAAMVAKSGGKAGCCGESCCGGSGSVLGPVTRDLYDARETAPFPREAVLASLGCGNPAALARLEAGEVVLDLGSGGGLDVLLAAERVGSTGKVYGLDMTDRMLALARENLRKTGMRNVEFLKGEIEKIPLPAGSVDVILSNCVINLSADKDEVLREAFRVLRPGGRLAVFDVIVRGGVPAELRKSLELWTGCLAGALEGKEYRSKLKRAGFSKVRIDVTREVDVKDARDPLRPAGIDVDLLGSHGNGKFASAFVRATKPGS